MLTDIKSNREGVCRPNWTDRQRIKKYLQNRNRRLVINITLDPRPSTWDPRPSTLDPRQKDRLCREGQKVTLVAVIGEFRSDLSITRKIDGNFGNVSAGVLFSKVAYQRKRWKSVMLHFF